MICPHCHADNKLSARFCNECGASLDANSAQFFSASEEPRPVTALGAPSRYSATTSVSCPSCGQGNFAYELNCKACGGQLTAWQYVSPEEMKRYTCWKCGGRYTQIFNQPNRGTGCVVVVLGILFAPILVGIILIIVGVSMMNETTSYWQCRSCGLTLPS